MMSKFLLFVIMLLTISSCRTNNGFTYYHSKEKDNTVTEMILDGKVYITNRHYDIKEVPEAYVSPSSGVDNYYYCYVYWENGETYIVAGHGEWETFGLTKNFHFEKIEDNQRFNEFTRLYKDKYIIISGSIAN